MRAGPQGHLPRSSDNSSGGPMRRPHTSSSNFLPWLMGSLGIVALSAFGLQGCGSDSSPDDASAPDAGSGSGGKSSTGTGGSSTTGSGGSSTTGSGGAGEGGRFGGGSGGAGEGGRFG